MLTTQQYAQRIKALHDFTAGRNLDADEAQELDDLLKGIERSKAFDRQLGDIDGGGAHVTLHDGRRDSTGGPGDMFVASEGYKSIQNADTRPQQWSTGPVEVPYYQKGTLLESTAGGPGGGLVPPQYVPGVVQTLFQPLTVADLLATTSTSASQIRYVNEGTATNAADTVAEGALKPESTLGLSEVVEPIRKIATWLPISDEMLEDSVQVQSYVNSRLSLFVSIKEEQQLLYGDGTAPNISGIFDRAGFQNHNAAGTLIAEIREMITKSRTSFLEPDGLVVHPNQWESIELYRTTTGEFQTDPFRSGPKTLWGLPVVVTNAIGAGTCLVGSFKQAAEVYRRGGMSIEASSSHSDFFVRNLQAIRAETRLGLAVYRESSFVRGTAAV